MIGSATMFGAMAFCAKLASARLSGPQVAMIRFAVGLIPVLAVASYRRSALKFDRVDLLLYRGLFGGLAVLLYFIAIEKTTAGLATLLNYTAPLWSGIFSMLFIGEKFSAKVLLPLPIAFTGVILVVRAYSAPADAGGYGWWALLGAASAVASGAAVTAMRAARRTENSWSVYASFCLFGLLVTAPFGLWTWKTPQGTDWFPLAATALLAIGAQLMLTFSLRWVDAMTVGVISQLAVPLAMVLGILFIGEKINAMAVIGTIVTMTGVVGVTYVNSLSKPRAAADEVAPES